jgi:hypothetical protein
LENRLEIVDVDYTRHLITDWFIGHGHDAIKTGLKKQIDKGFIAAYVFTVRRLYIAA